MTDSEIIVVIRPSLKKVCTFPVHDKEGNEKPYDSSCRAAALNHMLYWISRKKKLGCDYWYCKGEDIYHGLAETWGVTLVRREVNTLVDHGFIGETKNPTWGVDRTKHFFFEEEQAKLLFEAFDTSAKCPLCIGFPNEIETLFLTHLINLTIANDSSIKCLCAQHGKHLIELIAAFDKSINAFDKSDTAITKITTKITYKDISNLVKRDSFVVSANAENDPNTSTLHNVSDSQVATRSSQDVVDVATGNSTTKESEHRANANTFHYPGGSVAQPIPPAGFVQGSQPADSQEREGEVDHVPDTASTSVLPPASDTADLPPGQTEPPLPEMEHEQEADSAVTLAQQTTPPAESPPDGDTPSGIQQVSPSQRQLIEPPNTPEQHSGPFPSDTPVTPGAAQARQEKPRRTRKAPTPKPDPKPKFELDEPQQHFWQLWCSTWFNEGSPIQLTETAYGHVKTLAPFVTTPEQVDSLTKRARRDLQEMRGVQKKSVQLGNLVYSLPGWRQEQSPDEHRNEQKPPANPQPVLPLEAVKAARLARESHAVLQA